MNKVRNHFQHDTSLNSCHLYENNQQFIMTQRHVHTLASFCPAAFSGPAANG